jgi:hypothetical protein
MGEVLIAEGTNYAFVMRGNQVILRIRGKPDRLLGWHTKLANRTKVYMSPRNRVGIKGHGDYFEKFEGFAIGEALLDFLKENLFDEVHLKIGQRETLVSPMDAWWTHGEKYHKKGYEPQVVLPEAYMERKLKTLQEIMSA